MLKATAGGGGRGIRRVDGPDDLADAYQRTRDEAERAFGSGVVFLEKLVTGARHVEVQLIADGQGSAWAVGVRDCSVQRRNQKVIEESASALLDAEQTAELKSPPSGWRWRSTTPAPAPSSSSTTPERTFAFLEVNTRLQVEHPVTEADHRSGPGGAAAPGRRRRPAAGRSTGRTGPRRRGPAQRRGPGPDFAPAPGRIARLEFPTGPGVRVDTGVAEGDTIPADFDSMIAKIIAYGADRDEAIARLRRAMLETTVVIEGGATNKSFVLTLLDDPAVTRGEPAWADTGWIDRTMASGGLVADRFAGPALVAGAIEAYAEQERGEIAHFLATARGGRPQLQHEVERKIELKLRGTGHVTTVARIGPDQHRVTVLTATGTAAVTAGLERIDGVHGRLRIGNAAVPAGECRLRHHPAGRGERCRPPDQPGRGRHGPRPRTRPGGGHPGHGRHRGDRR